MNPLLLYSIVSDPFPLQASADGKPASKASLKIVATNNSGTEVKLAGMMVKIPIGTGSTQLSNDAKSIEGATPANWTMKDPQYPTGYVVYTFNPQPGYDVLPINSSLNFVFTSIPINTVTGTVLIELTEGSGGCIPPNCPVQILPVTKFPNGWGLVKFTATKNIVEIGQGIQLKWEGPAGATYSIEYYTPQTNIVRIPRPGEAALANEGIYPNQPLPLQQTTTFSLNVDQDIDGKPHHATSQVTVTVIEQPPVKIKSFTVTPDLVDLSSGSSVNVTLNWDVANANQLELQGRGMVTGQTSYSTRIAGTTEFTLRGYGNKSVDAQSVTAQSIRDFLLQNSFTLNDHIVDCWDDFDGTWCNDYALVENLQFKPDGTGSWKSVGDGKTYRTFERRDWRPFHRESAYSFTWTQTGNTVTAYAASDKLTMILTVSGHYLKYQQSFELYPEHSRFAVFNPMPRLKEKK